MTRTQPKMIFHPFQTLVGIFIVFWGCVYTACSNSEIVSETNIGIITDNSEITSDNNVWDGPSTSSAYTPNIETTSSSKILDYLPLDDSEYPYAGIPRIVIETYDQRAIKDRETEIPAKLQIWGANAPESEIMDLSIKGRGNSSWVDMPKKSYKIEFFNKQSMLEMPQDRDWALISNYADKTLMRNYLIYHLSSSLDKSYSPRCEFAELYLNRMYLGVYLISETIKKGKNRVNIPDNAYSYIIEIDGKYKDGEQVFFSDVIRENQAFRIHSPRNASEVVIGNAQNHIRNFEFFLKDSLLIDESKLELWIDIDKFIFHYWIQEVSKNPDATFTSVYFSWQKNGLISMGPVWDFDLAFGNYPNDTLNKPDEWYFRQTYWNKYIFKSQKIRDKSYEYWKNKKDVFYAMLDSIEVLKLNLRSAAQNNFKRWDVLNKTSVRVHSHAYNSYDDAIDSMKTWIEQRLQWIDDNI